MLKREYLDREDWLELAKRLPVGRSTYMHHGADRSPKMIVRNLVDRWTAYCHKCGMGGTVMKEHVKLTSPEALTKERPAKSTDPGPLLPIPACPENVQRVIIQHLQSKGVSLECFDAQPYYSAQDQRLVFIAPEGIIGRDLTGKHPAKWHSYNKSEFMRGKKQAFLGSVVVLTEDYYSAAKVSKYACNESVMGVAMLGTEIQPALVLELLRAEHVVLAFDGDAAGDAGYTKANRQLGLLDIPHSKFQVPAGLDPKDLPPEQLASAFTFWR